MIHYDFKPSKLEANGNGSYTCLLYTSDAADEL